MNITEISPTTLKSYVTKAGLEYFSQTERFHSYKKGFQAKTTWGNKSNGARGNYAIGLEYFGGHEYSEVTILKMRLWLTEQGIKYTMKDSTTILLVNEAN